LNIPYQRDAQYEKIPLDVSMPDSPTSSDSIYQTALNILPTIKSADLKIKAYQKAVLVNKGVYYPTLSLYGSISSNYSNLATGTILGPVTPFTTSDYVTVNGTNYNVITQQQSATFPKLSFGDQFKNNRYTQIGLSLNVPILNYLRARNNVKQAKINLKNAEYNANNTRLQLQQNVELAYQNMIAANGQYKSYQDQVAAYTESLRSADVKFKAGVITSVDYVIAKNNADRANTNLIAARYNFIFRTKILDYYQGRLSW
jgi:outer membrane protein